MSRKNWLRLVLGVLLLGASAVVLDFWGAAIGPIESCLRRNVDHGFSARRLRDGHGLASERYLPCPLAGRCRQRYEARASATGGSVVAQGRDPLCRCERRAQLVRLQDTSGKRCTGLAICHPGRITRFRSGVQHSDDAEPGGGRVTVTEDDAGRSHAEHVARSSGGMNWQSISWPLPPLDQAAWSRVHVVARKAPAPSLTPRRGSPARVSRRRNPSTSPGETGGPSWPATAGCGN